MKRKVIKQGHNTLTLTLPSKWVKKYNIQAGDDIEFDEGEDVLKLVYDKDSPLASVTIDITDYTIPLIWRSVSSAYRAGYDEIRIVWQDKDSKMKNMYTAFSYDTLSYIFTKKNPELTPLETLQALINRFIGVEIIDQRSTFCVVKELGETSYKDFHNSLRRIFLLILSMGEECEEALKGNHADLRAIHMTDTNLDRFEDFCFRILNKKRYEVPKKTPVVHTIIFLLELVGDEYKHFSIHYLKHEKQCSERVLKAMVEVNKQFRNFYELYYSFKPQKIKDIYEQNKVLEKLVHEDVKSISKEELEFYHHLKKISRFILSLTEARIDLEY